MVYICMSVEQGHCEKMTNIWKVIKLYSCVTHQLKNLASNLVSFVVKVLETGAL